MKCYYCKTELIRDFLGTCCPNEKCNSVDGKIRFKIKSNGVKEWKKNGKLHRENGPAIDIPGCSKEWYKNGQLHREDGPAIERPDGTKYWYKNGELHRENEPAIETNGHKAWYKNGLRHREDGPAAEWCDGTKYWYKNGLLHREDGPAVVFSDGRKEYWINDKKIKKKIK